MMTVIWILNKKLGNRKSKLNLLVLKAVVLKTGLRYNGIKNETHGLFSPAVNLS